jgi:DNA-binding NtrC family response regulator
MGGSMDKQDLKRVLIVDDEVGFLISCKKVMQCDKVSVDTVDTYDGAIHYLDLNRYDAVISDIRLENMNRKEGLSILNHIKSNYPDTKVLMITGHGSDDLMREAAHLHADSYFEKPVSLNVLKGWLKLSGIHVT